MTEARIHDQGYRRYEGERLGVSSAMSGLIVHALQRVLGLRRPLKSKLVPGLVLLIAFLPAVVFIGLAALLRDSNVADDILPSYPDYYGFIGIAVLLFVAFVAPEVICTDRNSGMLSLYLASPLTRDTYIVAKAAAVVVVLLMVTTAPQILLLVAYSLEGAGPGGVLDFIELFGRILVAGVAAAMMPAALSLAIASFTKRRAFASAAIVVTLLASPALAAALTEPDALGFDSRFGLIDLFGLPFEFAVRLLGSRSTGGWFATIDTSWVVAGSLGWTLLFAAVLRFSYQQVAADR